MQLLYTTIIIIVTRCKVYNKKKMDCMKRKDIEKRNQQPLYVRKGEQNLVES